MLFLMYLSGIILLFCFEKIQDEFTNVIDDRPNLALFMAILMIIFWPILPVLYLAKLGYDRYQRLSTKEKTMLKICFYGPLVGLIAGACVIHSFF